MVFDTDRQQFPVGSELIELCRNILRTDSEGRNWDRKGVSEGLKTPQFDVQWDSIEERICISLLNRSGNSCLMLTLTDLRGIVDGSLRWVDVVE
jgi:hypothetical protein